MAQLSITLTVSVLLFLFITNFSTPTNAIGGTTVGGRTKINDVKTNTEVQELGRYSVEEYNRKGSKGQNLKFSEVVEAEKQVVAGIKYYLKIAAVSKSTGVSKTFDVVVVVKPWVHSKELLNFAPSRPPK